MKIVSFMLAFCIADSAMGQADRFCTAAQDGLAQFAQARGLVADVRCRQSAATTLPRNAKLSSMASAHGAALRSGMLTWPVRVDDGNGRSYVYEVPLTVVLTAPAWVAARNLRPGADVQPDDVELKTIRWPEGLVVQVADPQSPPSGRLRLGQRAGDVLTTAALLTDGALMRGDAVTAVLTQGAIEVQMPARLQSPSRVGELVRAQVPGRLALLEGRLVSKQTLMVVSQ